MDSLVCVFFGNVANVLGVLLGETLLPPLPRQVSCVGNLAAVAVALLGLGSSSNNNNILGDGTVMTGGMIA